MEKVREFFPSSLNENCHLDAARCVLRTYDTDEIDLLLELDQFERI